MMKRLISQSVLTLMIVSLSPGSGCSQPPPQFVPPPPPTVTVAKPEQRAIPDTLEVTGVVIAHDTVEVRARVRGFIQKKYLEGGERVSAGQLLYEIDPRPFEATVRQAESELQARRASLTLAEVEYERLNRLYSNQNATEVEINRATAERDVADAQVKLAEAVLASAQLDLEFTQVRSPINGRLGIESLEVGDLVGATEPTLLATVADDSRVYIRYSLDERTVLAVRESALHQRPGENGRPTLVVLAGLLDEVGYPHQGVFARADIGFDPQTGTILTEAVFENPDGKLVPGAFARVRTMCGEVEALLVPEVAILADQAGRYVLTVDNANVVSRRSVSVGVAFEDRRVIQEGLSPDDWIIVNGVQRARPGLTVNVEGRSGEFATPGAEDATSPDGAALASETGTTDERATDAMGS